MITRMLLASVLAIGAGSFAGCGDTDCPATMSAGTSCIVGGAHLLRRPNGNCTCNDGAVELHDVGHLPAAPPHDMTTRDLRPATD